MFNSLQIVALLFREGVLIWHGLAFEKISGHHEYMHASQILKQPIALAVLYSSRKTLSLFQILALASSFKSSSLAALMVSQLGWAASSRRLL